MCTCVRIIGIRGIHTSPKSSSNHRFHYLILVCHYISLDSAKKLLILLCDTVKDEEKDNRLIVFQDSYAKGSNTEAITGSTHLIEIFKKFVDESVAKDVMSEILSIIGMYRNSFFSQLDSSQLDI